MGEKQYGVLSDRIFTHTNGDNQVETLYALRDLAADVLIEETAMRRNEERVRLSEDGQQITVDYPNCVATYRVIAHDPFLRAYECEFEGAVLPVGPVLDWAAKVGWQAA